MSTVQTVMAVVMIIASIFIIAVVLLQNGSQQGLGTISGGAETFFGSGKASARDKILGRVTTIVAILFAIIAVVLNLI